MIIKNKNKYLIKKLNRKTENFQNGQCLCAATGEIGLRNGAVQCFNEIIKIGAVKSAAKKDQFFAEQRSSTWHNQTGHVDAHFKGQRRHWSTRPPIRFLKVFFLKDFKLFFKPSKTPDYWAVRLA